jgi:DNA-binding HxlR family transcriptional regulator
VTTSVASADGRFDVLAAACPTRQVVSRLGDKWTLLVVYALSQQPYRFRELQRAVEGISQRMLTQTLRNLERDGVVHRSVKPTIPPQVTYSLTGLGDSLSGAIAQIRAWAYTNIEDVQTAQKVYDRAHE